MFTAVRHVNACWCVTVGGEPVLQVTDALGVRGADRFPGEAERSAERSDGDQERHEEGTKENEGIPVTVISLALDAAGCYSALGATKGSSFKHPINHAPRVLITNHTWPGVPMLGPLLLGRAG
ncbi:hypothetical protein MPNT_10058 [Candidatus Methylacidithermus pantelleriae]|uniref:Uncharacterized protein n=1 Tax=Candidatus Methylacidithermus pantelleriae TaxID=2744239 RepID=A0A8J2FMY5_9BACT|nr:hypothetical protein MPNT_10058 [Candidatus Methylacidithermus pantelleriae]